ncbi:class I SAM-dependent methyltransferase [Arcobacter cryaerophilus gv. pseudocryaerophilus]|uniref:Class I SAM-dependent methyltransferase n=2 Tax=Arcobacteraceae TaxID=2808963 RepID=A0AAU0P665_9BACT|nr:class I SAM-dependent methyltransferase [Arcobacter sp. AZ-2023]WPD04082.1 class I SAM-dependent methyltransferase [Arcobacter sp. DSM 115972]
MIDKKEIKDFFNKKIQEHGPTPEGLGWNGEEAQNIRFKQIIKVITKKSNFTINHLGCGYGALYDELVSHNFSNLQYRGYDISDEMIKAAKSKCKENNNLNFSLIDNSSEMLSSDYTVSSGIFNVKMNFSDEDWYQYIIKTLQDMNNHSQLGFAFNMLTSYSDKEFKREDLYYGDPCHFFDYCKRNFSKNISLLHDYNLYDFTIIVRK